MTDDEIKRLRRLCEVATPGPWAQDTGTLCNKVADAYGRLLLRVHEDHERYPHDAAFIAAAREALPKLLDEVEAWKTRCGEFEAAADRASQRADGWQQEAMELHEEVERLKGLVNK